MCSQHCIGSVCEDEALDRYVARSEVVKAVREYVLPKLYAGGVVCVVAVIISSRIFAWGYFCGQVKVARGNFSCSPVAAGTLMFAVAGGGPVTAGQEKRP